MEKNLCLRGSDELICFADIANDWLASKSYKIKKSTFNKYNFLFERYIFPQFNNLNMAEVSTAVLDKKIMRMYEEYKNTLSHSTFKSMLYLIKAVIGYAIKTEYISQIYINFEIAEHKEQKEIQVFSQEQEKKLVSEITTAKTSNHLGILLSLYTGIRLGEVCSLKAGDIDFVSKTIKISKTVQRLSTTSEGTSELIVTSPKSQHSVRVIPLPHFLYEILISYGINKYLENHYILTNKELPYEPRTLQYAFQRIIKRCGYSELHFHCLRHTFATKCVRAGFDIKTLSEILGHSSVSFTMNRYVHSDLDIKRKQMDILNESWEKMEINIS